MECKVTFTKRRQAGETIADMVIALGLGALLFGALSSSYLYSARSFADLENYMTMDGNARYALDLMTSDIRQADGISAYSSNSLTLIMGTNKLTYMLNTARRTLQRQFQSVTTTVLTDCQDLRYNVYQRNPANGVYDYFPNASSATNSKLVEISLLCTRPIMGRTADSAMQQSARVVIRKQK